MYYCGMGHSGGAETLPLNVATANRSQCPDAFAIYDLLASLQDTKVTMTWEAPLHLDPVGRYFGPSGWIGPGQSEAPVKYRYYRYKVECPMPVGWNLASPLYCHQLDFEAKVVEDSTPLPTIPLAYQEMKPVYDASDSNTDSDDDIVSDGAPELVPGEWKVYHAPLPKPASDDIRYCITLTVGTQWMPHVVPIIQDAVAKEGLYEETEHMKQCKKSYFQHCRKNPTQPNVEQVRRRMR